MAFFTPDRYFSRISCISVQHDLIERGFMFGLLDIDNTLLRRDNGEVPRDVELWLASAKQAGITFCLVSNNWHKSVHEVAQYFDLPIVTHAMKPFPAALFVAMHRIGSHRSNTVVIGDQLMTDVLAAHFAGMCAYMLQPLVEQDLPHTLFLRNFERLAMGDRQPEPVPSSANFQVAESVEAKNSCAGGDSRLYL